MTLMKKHSTKQVACSRYALLELANVLISNITMVY